MKLFKNKSSNSTVETSLNYQTYMSENALKFLEVKYNSTVSESQRTMIFKFSSVTNSNFQDSKVIFLKSLSQWFENKINFEDSQEIKLGNELKPVLSNVKTKMRITTLVNEEDHYEITFYVENPRILYWTTFKLYKLFKWQKNPRFVYTEKLLHENVRDRMSPDGLSQRWLLRRDAKKRYSNFVDTYEKLVKQK